MKIKKLLIALVSLAMVPATMSLASCKSKEEEKSSIEEHVHTFASEWSHDDNYHWHAATCEHTSEKADYAAHDWDDGEVTIEPSEVEVGVKTFTCKTCGWTKTEEIDVLPHTHKPDNSGHCAGCGEDFGFTGNNEQISGWSDNFTLRVVNGKAYLNAKASSEEMKQSDFTLSFEEYFETEPNEETKSIVKEVRVFDSTNVNDNGLVAKRQNYAESDTKYYFDWVLDTKLSLDKLYNIVITLSDDYKEDSLKVTYFEAFEFQGPKLEWDEDNVWEVEYDGQPHGVNIEVSEDADTYAVYYKLKGEEDSSYKLEQPVEAGEYLVYAYAENLYCYTEIEHEFKITGKKLAITAGMTTTWKGNTTYTIKLNNTKAPGLLEGDEVSVALTNNTNIIYAQQYSNIRNYDFDAELVGADAANYTIDWDHTQISLNLGLAYMTLTDKTADLLAGFADTYQLRELKYYKFTPTSTGIYKLSGSSSYLDCYIDTFESYPEVLAYYGEDEYYLEEGETYIIEIGCRKACEDALTVKLSKEIVTSLDGAVGEAGTNVSQGENVTMFRQITVNQAGVYHFVYSSKFDYVEVIGAEWVEDGIYSNGIYEDGFIRLEKGNYYIVIATEEEVTDARVRLTLVEDASTELFSTTGINDNINAGNHYFYTFEATTAGEYLLNSDLEDGYVEVLGFDDNNILTFETGVTYILHVYAGQEDTTGPAIYFSIIE